MAIQNSTVDAYGAAAFALVSALVEELAPAKRNDVVAKASDALKAALVGNGLSYSRKAVLNDALVQVLQLAMTPHPDAAG
jgi:hypothetical protein